MLRDSQSKNVGYGCDKILPYHINSEFQFIPSDQLAHVVTNRVSPESLVPSIEIDSAECLMGICDGL